MADEHALAAVQDELTGDGRGVSDLGGSDYSQRFLQFKRETGEVVAIPGFVGLRGRWDSGWQRPASDEIGQGKGLARGAALTKTQGAVSELQTVGGGIVPGDRASGQ